MAGSRVEKLSTIFKRYTGLIKSGAVLEENRPLWYDVYKNFPPKDEPLAIRSEPTGSIPNIYYPEDILRSRFTRAYGNNATVKDFVSSPKDATAAKSPQNDACELFIGQYLKLAKSKLQPGEKIDLNDETLFSETETTLRDEFGLSLQRNKGRSARDSRDGRMTERVKRFE